MSIDKALLDQLMEGRSPGDLFGKEGIRSELTKALAERALSTELDEHLEEERAATPDEGANRSANRRNGASQKTVTTDSGKVVLDIPRDRNGTFDPLLSDQHNPQPCAGGQRDAGSSAAYVPCCRSGAGLSGKSRPPDQPAPASGDDAAYRHL